MNPPSYLPGLNVVRFYLALCVVIIHTTRDPLWHALTFIGPDAVTGFFTLSGFLITYRLLLERKRVGRIDLRAFYIRRELRILPLYYLSLFVGAFVLPLFGAPIVTRDGLIGAMLLFPQVPHAFSHYTALGTVGSLWSLGVEELFYLTLPLLLRRFHLVKLCLVIIGTSVLAGEIARLGASWEVYQLVKFMRFECMAVGVLMAWMVVERSRWLRVLRHPVVELGVFGALVCVAAFDPSLILHDFVLACLFAVFLMNISANPKARIKLEWRWSKAAGDLTYGIYIWHLPIVWLLNGSFDGNGNVLITIITAVSVAFLSYQLVEQPILRLKDRLGAQRTVSPVYP